MMRSILLFAAASWIFAGGCAFRPHAVMPDRAIRHVLATTTGVEISLVTDNVGEAGFNIGVARPGMSPENARELIEFRRCERFHDKPTGKPSDRDFLFAISGFDGHYWNDYVIYSYSSRTGELGNGNEWCYASAPFRSWMQTMNHRTARRHFDTTNYYGVTVIAPRPQTGRQGR